MPNTGRLIASLCSILFLIIFCPRGVQAQTDLDGYWCAECPASYYVAFGPDTTVSLTIGSCTVQVTYAKRKCAAYYDLNIKSIQVSGSCSYTTEELATLGAVKLIYSNPMKFPPFGRPANESAPWRIVRSACWSKNVTTGMISPCPQAPCCEAYVGVSVNNCNQTIITSAYQKKRQVVCGNPPMQGLSCVNSCANDLMGDYFAILGQHSELQ